MRKAIKVMNMAAAMALIFTPHLAFSAEKAKETTKLAFT